MIRIGITLRLIIVLTSLTERYQKKEEFVMLEIPNIKEQIGRIVYESRHGNLQNISCEEITNLIYKDVEEYTDIMLVRNRR